ncbi:MAG: trans-aconitate 2-methyltransferase [Alphaproteobacteria bacterium]|nr:trans-aconitate 2-methyltransferase [Alphaproteobacteria bacterium]
MSWDPSIYLSFDAERTRPAVDLTSRIPTASPRVVIDLGCGPGNSTAILARRWPSTRLIGVDNSAEMLAAAAKSSVRAEWQEADLRDWSASEPASVIFSNAAFQWLDGHAAIFPRLIRSLEPNGVLAIQMPRNFDAPSHVLLREIANDPRWSSKVARFNRTDPVASPAAYYAMLCGDAASLDIWQTEYQHVLDGEDAVFKWVSGTALVPYVAALDGGDRKEFLNVYRERLARAYPRQSNGKTLFPFKRIFIVATR